MKMSDGRTVKNTFWGAAAFYFLIAFEFLYMASPFAVYFYSVYRPVLNFFNEIPVLSGLIRYFMPHFTTTSSTLINLHNIVGGVLALGGFICFSIGACQVYYHKLARKGAVTGGVYNFIRHPQYASFIVCSFGLLLLWPRYIVLIMFVTMLLAYYLLARVEERECEAKFGQSYIDYKNKTGMFLPFKLSSISQQSLIPRSKAGKIAAGLGLYIAALAVSLVIAAGLDNLTLNSLYASYKDDSATISISRIEPEKLEEIISIVMSDAEVKNRIEEVKDGGNVKLLNYVLPSQWFAAEIPMNGISRASGHRMPSNYDRNSYKVIFNKATVRPGESASGKDILVNLLKREPVAEVWVDVSEKKVVKILEMPEEIMYENTPVALY